MPVPLYLFVKNSRRETSEVSFDEKKSLGCSITRCQGNSDFEVEEGMMYETSTQRAGGAIIELLYEEKSFFMSI